MNEEIQSIQPGDRVGPYRIVRNFEGRGGMGGVFEAEVREKHRQPNLPIRLALKVAREDFEGALKAEANFLQRFDHPNVVRIFPIAGYHRPVYAARSRFRFGWGWYYTMELVGGGSLEQRLTRPTTVTDALRPSGDIRRLSLLGALGVARQLASALSHIHTHNVINLDVKPGNVLFRKRRFKFLKDSVPEAVLCDFGIARDVRYPRTGLLGVATPEYVSPEHASEMGHEHQPVDFRSDIFSLGILLYEILTGTLPFDSIALIVDPQYSPTPPREIRPSIPPRLEEIIMRAMAKEPAHRFQTADEMLTALKEVRKPPDWQATARRTFAGATVIASLAAVGFGISQVANDDQPTPRPTTPSPTAQVATSTLANTPTSSAPDASPTTSAARATSTPAPTLTPTNTYPPPTPTSEEAPPGG